MVFDSNKASGDAIDMADLYDRIGAVLVDESRPMKERFRALFTLRNLPGKKSVDVIARGFKDSSALLKHECAYCLGQMRDPYAVDVLISVIEDLSQEPIVRHEAGEGLAAISDARALPVLKRFANDPNREVSETCQLALERLEWIQKNPEKLSLLTSQYLSHDPTPCSEEKDEIVLERQLLDEKETLFNRYSAMFALRNIGSDAAVRALTKGLNSGGALFRHEIAYVLGQIQSPLSVKELSNALADDKQDPMVRHECADALGSIADEYGSNMLKRYLNDPERVVRESCEIGLDMAEYENSGEFQYANSLEMVQQSS